MSMLTRFRKSMRENFSLPGGSHILVAVSGGADSVALLSLLQSVSGEFGWVLEVAHLDHSLREESPVDAAFVADLCAEYGLPLTQKRIDVAGAAMGCKGNLEEVAREIRRTFLIETAETLRCDYIALGHHLNDQAETFLMRLIRGSGTKGLAGMSYRDNLIIRPLLPFTRSEIIDYLESEGLEWREDESNNDLDLTRNRVRKTLVPLLEDFNPNVTRQIAGLSEQLQDDELFWAEYIDALLVCCVSQRDDLYIIDRLQLVEMMTAVSHRMIRTVLEKVRGDLRAITSTHIRDVMQLAQGESRQVEISLPGAWVARRYDEVLFCRQKPAEPQVVDMTIRECGRYVMLGGELHVSLEEEAKGIDQWSVEFSAGELALPVRLRSISPGDRLQPAGMRGSKKLQDLFVDLKMTREQRLAALLLCKDENVLWVAGIRRSALFPPVVGEPVLRFVFVPE